MALRVTDGIPIEVPVAQPGLTLQDVFDSTRTAALVIERRRQAAGAWCYAACAEMVINFTYAEWVADQCHIVSLVKNGPAEGPLTIPSDFNSCCNTNALQCIQKGCELDDIGKIFDFFKITHETSGNAADPVLRRVGLAKLTAEFQAGRPVEVIVDWDEEGSHAVLVTGVVDNMIFVIDPLEDGPYGGWQTVHSLESGFGLGTWARTWPGLRRI